MWSTDSKQWWLWFDLVWFYGISTIVGYLIQNPLYTYVLNIYDLVWFYSISTIVGYLIQNPLYTYVLNIYDLVWFYSISTIVGYLIQNPLYTYVLNIYMICKHILSITFLNERSPFLHTVK